MNPPSLMTLSQLAVKFSILQTLRKKWTKLWKSGRNLPFGDNCVKFACELQETLYFLEASGTIPVTVAHSLCVFSILKQVAKSLSSPDEWCNYARDVKPSVSMWFSNPSKFSTLIDVFANSDKVASSPPLHPFHFWYPPDSPYYIYHL